jgi:serine protease Do
MQQKRRILQAMAAALVLLCLSPLICISAQAEDADYAQIGWWQIIYRHTGTQTGCQAEARFSDQTNIAMALVQQDDSKSWLVFISNPRWNSWISKKRQHIVVFATINPNKIWRGPWGVVNDNELALSASIDFVNSIADAKELAILDEKGGLLTAPLNMKDSEAAIKAVVNCVRAHPLAGPSGPEAEASPDQPATTISGTAFFIASNLLLTNNHVVKECRNSIQVRYPEQTSYMGAIAGQDETNDLALLRTDMSNLSVASFRSPAQLGEPVATYGFPYSDILSSGGNFTLGSVTSLSGLRNDSRFIQIQAPVQPGNSGGPLLDMSGSVIGVVAGRLDAILLMQGGGGVPQNINFAIQAPIVINFLSTKGITPKLDTPGARRVLPPSDVADLAKSFTVQVYCDTAPARTSKVSPSPKPQTQTTGIEQQAKNFAIALQTKWSQPNAAALARLDEMYEDEVMYFGKKSTKDDVIKEKTAFARKFPQRTYRPREPISVSCSDQVCMVHGLVDFRSIDPVAKIQSEGVATFEYEFIFAGGGVKIRMENGAVLKRDRTPLALSSAHETLAIVPAATTWQKPR